MCDAETNGENTIDYILASELPHLFVHELENSEDSDDDDYDDVPLAKLLALKANANDENANDSNDDDTPLWKLARKDFPTQSISTGTRKVDMRTQTEKSGMAQKQQKQVATVEQVAELFFYDEEDFYDAPASTLSAGAGVIQVPSCTATSQAPASSQM